MGHSTARRFFRACMGAALLLAGAGMAQAQPVRLIVPFAAGGTSDVVARTLAESVSRATGRPVVVDNRAGAGGALGMEALASSPADGSSVALMTAAVVGNMAAAGKPVPAFEVVAGIGLEEFVLAVHRSAPDVRSLRGAIGTFGPGSLSQICAEELARHLPGLQIVPYKGTAPAITDLSNGQLVAGCVPVASAMAQINSGSLRAAAMATPQRSRQLPAVPTLEELGITDALLSNWIFVVAPPGTPAQAKSALTSAFVGAVQKADERLRALGMEPLPAADAADTQKLQAFLQRRVGERK